MKVSGKASLGSFLSAPNKGFSGALVYGPNYGLISAVVDRIKECLAAEVRFFVCSDVKKDPGLLAQAISEVSFLKQDALLVVRDIGNTESMGKILQGVLENNSDGNYVVFVGGAIESKSSLRMFFEKSAKYAAVACYEDSPEVTAGVIRKWVRKNCPGQQECNVGPLVSRFIGADRLFIVSELDRLSLMFADDDMSIEVLAALLDDFSIDRDSMNRLCSAVLCGDIHGTVEAFDEAAALNECGLIARSITRYVHRILIALEYVRLGKSHSDAVNQLSPPVFFKLKADFMRHMKAISSVDARAIITRLSEYEVSRSAQYCEAQVVGLLHTLTECARLVSATSVRA